jgi:hypothetical protein
MDRSTAALIDPWSPSRRRREIDEPGSRYAVSGERVVRYHDLDDNLEEPPPDPRASWRDTWQSRPASDEELERLREPRELAPSASRPIGGLVFKIFGLVFTLRVRRAREAT